MKPFKFKAWAVIDSTGKKPPDGYDLCENKARADWLRTARANISHTRTPGAKWKVVRVIVKAA